MIHQSSYESFSPFFGIIGGDLSDKIMHNQNEQIISIRVINNLDALLAARGCYRGNADSSPASTCDHLGNLDQRPWQKIVA